MLPYSGFFPERYMKKEQIMFCWKKKDEMLEVWDWKTARPAGKAISRKKAHLKGIPHEGVHIWIISTAGTEPLVLFQHRSEDKDSYPDCLDITVGGHVPFGLYENRVQKEAEEELGISPADERLFELGMFRYEENEKSYCHREFQNIYLMEDNRPLDRYRFNDGEVTGIYAVPLPLLEKLLKDDFSFEAEGYDGKALTKRTLSRKDFHPLLFADSMKIYMKVLLTCMYDLVETGAVNHKMPPL